MNNKLNIAELQALLQQERIRNSQLERKAAQATDELENLLSFFNQDEQEMNKEIVKLKKVAAYWQKLAEELKEKLATIESKCTLAPAIDSEELAEEILNIAKG